MNEPVRTSQPDLTTSATYPAQPDRECDLIMKGGISSGIVSPRAACTLAVTYRFRSVGGASAGAIAAAAAAAAEHGRETGGFVRLAALPDLLGTTLAASSSRDLRRGDPSRSSPGGSNLTTARPAN